MLVIILICAIISIAYCEFCWNNIIKGIDRLSTTYKLFTILIVGNLCIMGLCESIGNLTLAIVILLYRLVIFKQRAYKLISK